MIAGAGDQITGIAAAEEIDRRHRIESNISAAKRELTTALQQTVFYWTKKQAHEKAAQDLLDLNAQLVTLAEKRRALRCWRERRRSGRPQDST